MRATAALASLCLAGVLPVGGPEARAEADPEHVAVLAAVEDVREEIARVRGLPWKRRVETELLTRDALKARLGKMLKEDVDQFEYEKSVRALRRYGMLREDEDLLRLYESMMGDGILAYYDPDTGRIYVVLGPEVDALRPTIAHELVHALEDQHVGIQDAQDAVEGDPDALFALSCVVEGSAERGRALWEVENPLLARRARMAKDDPRMASAMQSMLAKTPAYLIVPTQFHYQRGIAFVERAIGSDYAAGMGRLYRDPPTTQEQVLHPQRYGFPGAGARGLRDLPRRIHWGRDVAEAAGAGWTLLDDEESGELDFALWIDYFLGACKGLLDVDLMRRGEWCAPEAKTSSEGWDGARAAFLKKEGHPLGIVSASAWDTAEDARQAARAMRAALRARWGAAFGEGRWVREAANGDTPERAPHRLDYEAPGLRGRIEVREDVVLWLEADLGDAFERVFEALRWTVFERDPLDRPLTATTDPLHEADWRSREHGIGWRRPDGGWSRDVATATRATFSKGPVTVSLEAFRGALRNAASLPSGLDVRIRNGLVEPQEATVRGKSGQRLSYEVPGDDGSGTRHVIVVLLLSGDDRLLLHARSPLSAKARYAVDVERAIDGILVED